MKELKITTNKFKPDYKSLKLTKKQELLLKKSILNQKKVLKKHFKDDEWDLCSSHIVTDVLYDVFGPLYDYILLDLIGKNIYITFNDEHGLVYRKKK